MRIPVVVTLGALLSSGQALAARKVLILGAGDCREPTLTTSVKQFHDEARPLLKTQLFEPDVVLDAMRPRPSRSLQDIQRLVDSARTLLYGGQNDRGLELVKQALVELDRASPQVNPWPVTSAALMVQSQLYKNLDRTKEMNEAYRRVLRIDPGFQLDPDAYPPSTLQVFEAVRKELLRARKGTLVVQSTLPGTSVFVDGRELGQAPLKLELVPGRYRLWLMRAGRVSFPHLVDVKDVRKETTLQVDMGFESAVSQQPPLCVSASDEQALKLGGLMAADDIIVVRSAATAGNPPYVTAVLYDATARLQRNGGAPPDFIGRLATFIVTGREQDGVRKGTEPPVAVAVARPPGVAPGPNTDLSGPKPPEQPGAPAEKIEPLPPSPPDVTKAGPSSARVVSYALIAAGVGGAVAGAVVYASGAADRDRLTALTVSDGRLYPPGTPNHAEAVALMPKVDANRTLAFTLLGAGAGVAVAGVLGALLLPGESTQLALVPTEQGGWVSVSGRF